MVPTAMASSVDPELAHARDGVLAAAALWVRAAYLALVFMPFVSVGTLLLLAAMLLQRMQV